MANRCIRLIVICLLLTWCIPDRVTAETDHMSWRGRATARVNVRKAPGRDSEIMTQIDRGEEVTVASERQGWYKVLVNGETFEFAGWIYAKYITRADGDGIPDADVQREPSSPVSTPQTEAAGSKTRDLLKSDATPRTALLKSNTQAPRPEVVEDIDPSPKIRIEKSPKQGASTGARRVDGNIIPAYEPPGNMTPERVMNRIASRQSVSPAGRESLGVSPVVKKKKTPVHEGTMTPAVAHSQSDKGYQTVTGTLIRLMVVAFSCLAILFAHRAWLTVARGHREGKKAKTNGVGM